MTDITNDQGGSSVDAKIAGKLPGKNPSRGFSKGDARYWMVGDRLFKDDSADYSCRFSLKGRRAQFCLLTSNQREAAKRAAELFTLVAREGWEAGFSIYRPQAKKSATPTIGDLMTASMRLSSARKETLEAYTKAFRRIVSEIRGIEFEETDEGGAWAHWRKRVDAVNLADIKPADVVAWKQSRLRQAADPVQKGRTIVTVNSLIRNAKALFGKKVLPFLDQELEIPRPLPFEGIGLEKAPSMRYVSRMDAFAILAQAREELAADDPEAFKVLVLALVCGLRRGEIDNLLWRAFDFHQKVLRVESTEFHELKSSDSVGEIDLNNETTALFRGFRAKSPTAVFVIDSEAVAPGRELPFHRKAKPSRETKTRTYRCDQIFSRAIKWLREQGVNSTKPLHTMRKEIGSIIAREHGIFEASRYLRHSDIRITAAIYVDKKKTVTPATFDGLLSESSAPVSIDSASIIPDRQKSAKKKKYD